MPEATAPAAPALAVSSNSIRRTVGEMPATGAETEIAYVVNDTPLFRMSVPRLSGPTAYWPVTAVCKLTPDVPLLSTVPVKPPLPSAVKTPICAKP